MSKITRCDRCTKDDSEGYFYVSRCTFDYSCDVYITFDDESKGKQDLCTECQDEANRIMTNFILSG